MRDPRVDPQPSDVLIAGPQWQSERYEVTTRGPDFVCYQYWPSTSQHSISLIGWRDLMRGAEVVHAS